jgi:hypothetical protein
MSDILETPPTVDEAFGASRLRVWLRPEIAVTRIEGHFSDELAKRFVDELDGTLRASKHFLGLHDWTDTATFDVAVPARLAAWSISHIARVGRIVIATQHPLVSMAVRTTNLSIKRIEHLSSREAWVEVVRKLT